MDHRSAIGKSRRRYALRVVALLAAALLPSVMLFAGVSLPLLPCPRWLVPVGGMIAFFLPLVGPAIALGYLLYGAAVAVGAFWQPRPVRGRRLALGLSLLGGLAMAIALVRPAVATRLWLLHQIPVRARPLIAALERYHQDHGQYPRYLTDLVPRYLERIPGTGVPADPKFKYERADGASSYSRAYWPNGQPPAYELSLHCPEGVPSFDSMHYWPSQQYPEEGWGGPITRIDGWAYASD